MKHSVILPVSLPSDCICDEVREIVPGVVACICAGSLPRAVTRDCRDDGSDAVAATSARTSSIPFCGGRWRRGIFTSTKTDGGALFWHAVGFRGRIVFDSPPVGLGGFGGDGGSFSAAEL